MNTLRRPPPASRLLFCALPVVLSGILSAQTYQVDWSVVASAGGTMAGPTFRVQGTAGQTAAGPIAGPTFHAYVGFWQIDTMAVGVRDAARQPVPGLLETALGFPTPNPARDQVLVRYSLAFPARVRIQLLDLAGRALRTVVDDGRSPGRYSLTIDLGPSAGACPLSRGVLFLRMTAGDFTAARKLIVD